MNELSERDKIIIDLKSELFNIQQNSKNIKKLEESNCEFQNEIHLLREEISKLEFMLNNERDQSAKQIYELESEIKNLEEELSKKKDTNISLFVENENLDKKVEILTKENQNLSQKIKKLMSLNEENKKTIEKYIQKIKVNENNNNYKNNQNIEKYKNKIKELKQKYEKNINYFQAKINELQIAINQLYCDNKKLVKIYKISFNKKEINEKVISSLIKSNLLPKNILDKEKNYDEEFNNSKLKRNNSNYDIINTNPSLNNKDFIKKIKFPSRTKTPSRESLNSKKKIIYKNISQNNNEDDISKKCITSNFPRGDNHLLSPYGHDINKSYNYNNMKKNNNNLLIERAIKHNKENINNNFNVDFTESIYFDKNYSKYFQELIKSQEDNIILKKKILNLVNQNEKLINEIDSIVQVSGMSTIDVTTEGIKHLEQIIFNNREMLEKYLDDVKSIKT